MKRNALLCGNRYTDKQREKALRLYASGMPSAAVSARVGCSPTILVRWVRKAGMQVRRDCPPICDLPALPVLWRDRRELGSWRKVAEKYGVSITTVWRRKEAVVAP